MVNFKYLKSCVHVWFKLICIFIIIIADINYAFACGGAALAFTPSYNALSACKAESSTIKTLTCNGVLVGSGCGIVGGGAGTMANSAMASAMTGAATAAACTLVVQGEQAACKTAVETNNACYTKVETESMAADLSACKAECGPCMTANPTCIGDCEKEEAKIKSAAAAGKATDQTTDAAYTAMGAAVLAGLGGLLKSSKKSKEQLDAKPVNVNGADAAVSAGTGSSDVVTTNSSNNGSDTNSNNNGSGNTSNAGNNGITSTGKLVGTGVITEAASTGGAGLLGTNNLGSKMMNPSNLANKIVAKPCAPGDVACVCAASGKYTASQCNAVVNKFGLGNNETAMLGDSKPKVDSATTSGLDSGAGASSASGSGSSFSGGDNSQNALGAKTEVSSDDSKKNSSSGDAVDGGSGYSSAGNGAADAEGAGGRATANKAVRNIASTTLSPNAALAAANIAAKNGNLFELVSKRYFIECTNGKTIAGECIK
jgi:hypothetical protein